MERWQFIQSPAGDWYWLCSEVISHKTRTSAATFKTRTECMADAMWYGYQKVGSPGPPPKAKGAPPRGRSKSRARNRSGS